ncbi:tripartite tricarboxylate transporter TctB family protein [Pseudomonas matsuisoli]|uniref:DUF1468 domain-containing protein n=1 Tax=Pseudomonas matsuisoli TaxID=1515666 RepID=A0A917PN12_9PSED|nr:tripartite tricarboxylate transporter TctB family protein [Pseudomonas matsuisoli]GGJ85668.1 hypothetical protein GCM10009304_09660 [Pseudomonas matsuisoli]
MNISQRLNLGDRNNDFLLALAMIASGTFFLFQTMGITGEGQLLPVAICGVMLVAGIGLLLKALVRAVKSSTRAPSLGIDSATLKPIALVFLILAAAVLVTPYLGYFSGATVMLILIPVLLKYREWKKVLLITLFFEIGVFLVFVEGFGKRLPSGWLY